MKPIISPLWIYFADKSGSLGEVSMAIGFISLVIYILYCWLREEDKIKKSIVIPLIIVALIGALLPSKDTIYTMIVVDQITPDNIALVGETGENLIDYITEKVDEIVNKESKDKK